LSIGIIVNKKFENKSGVGTYMHQLLHELNRLNKYSINLICSNGEISYQMPVLQTAVPFLSHKDELWYLSLPILINYRHKNLKVVHNIIQLPTFFKFKNAKYIITVHDLIPVLFPKEVKLRYHLLFKVFLPRTLQ
jgi:hypothetical protein